MASYIFQLYSSFWGKGVSVMSYSAMITSCSCFPELAWWPGVQMWAPPSAAGLETKPQNLPKASADEIYAQIATDLKTAIEIMPASKYQDTKTCTHASKWAAESLMARVFLFYTGYYNKESLPTADGSSISKQQVITWLEDCINNSGHALLADQRSLWPYTYENTAKTYKYMDGVSARWATDNNEEVIFALGFGNYSSGDLYSNRMIEWYDLRLAGDNRYPFVATGYSNGPVNRGLWDDWANDPDYAGDYRREGSICDRTVEMPDYKGDPSKEVENSKLFAKKCVEFLKFGFLHYLCTCK